MDEAVDIWKMLVTDLESQRTQKKGFEIWREKANKVVQDGDGVKVQGKKGEIDTWAS